jgi:hypothetical protein
LGAVVQSELDRQVREQAPSAHLSLELGPQSASWTQPQPAIADAHAGSAEPVQIEHIGPQSWSVAHGWQVSESQYCAAGHWLSS